MSDIALATRGLSKSFGSLVVARDIALELPVGCRVSFFPMAQVRGIASSGLDWVLEGVELQPGGQRPVVKTFPCPDAEKFKYQIDAASAAIRNGETESPVMPLAETIMIAETIDRIKKQLGLSYRNDEQD